MRDSAKILSIASNGSVKVLPLIKNACISCTNTSCAKAGKPFTAQNPHSLSLKPGMTVRISAKKSSQAVQAFISLFIPLICAAGGWFAANTYALSKQLSGESLQAAGVLLGLFIPSIVILCIRRHKTPAYSEITEILD
ncbi:SoxR reducing system RseC family protein [Treponema sp. OMZ 840]|uniref:SoxR reducing system RseC family protein n=1 Tax=Treponema sp. OMZ 840 TaxID=244313 RepID=UPI003D945ED6